MTLDSQTKAQIVAIAKGQLRHYLGLAGAALATHGIIAGDAASQSQFVQVASGVVLALVAAGWSWWKETGAPKAQARLVELVAQAEAKKQAAAAAYAQAQAQQAAVQSALAAPKAPVPQPAAPNGAEKPPV